MQGTAQRIRITMGEGTFVLISDKDFTLKTFRNHTFVSVNKFAVDERLLGLAKTCSYRIPKKRSFFFFGFHGSVEIFKDSFMKHLQP